MARPSTSSTGPIVSRILARISLSDLSKDSHRVTAMPLTRRPADGYGRKLPTRHMVRYENRWRRVYCCIYSNAGTCYILKGGGWIVVDE